MAYYEATLTGDRTILVEEVPIRWSEMAALGPDASNGAATASLGDPRAARTALMLARVAAGGHIAAHAAPIDGMAFVMAGSGSLGLPGREPLHFQGGDAILVGANVLHSWDAGANVELVLGVTMLG